MRPTHGPIEMSMVISKGAFAALVGVSGARLSQWLAAKKISGEAIVGTGYHARIAVDIALEQLRMNLDPIQHSANGRARLHAPRSIDLTSLANSGAASPDLIEGDQIKLARLENYRRNNRRVLDGVGAWLPSVAATIAERFGIPAPRALALLCEEFQSFRVTLERKETDK
jgi:DNA-binding transcriptional regulator YdaS (Cro superfamily)